MTVVAAAIVDSGRVLVVRRAPGQKLAGKWEFPGGKVEAGENEAEALARELREELGISGAARELVGESAYEYAFGRVTLRLYRFDWLGGDIALSVHDRLDWAPASELCGVDFAPADVPLAERLSALIGGAPS